MTEDQLREAIQAATSKDTMTPRGKRRKAVTEAVRQATRVSCNSNSWHEQFDKVLEQHGYRVTKTSWRARSELRNSVTADTADAPAIAGDRRCDPGATSAATGLRMRGDGMRDSRDGARKGNSRRTADSNSELRQRQPEGVSSVAGPSGAADLR